jgi:hypothetical protein
MRKLIVVLALFVTTLAHSESLEDKKYWKGQMDYLNRGIEDASKKCEVAFTFEWVNKEKLRAAAAKNGNSPFGICEEIVIEVGRICAEGDDEKAAVKAKIKSFKCGYANPRTLGLRGGAVTYMGNQEQSNFSDWARPWLLKRL